MLRAAPASAAADMDVSSASGAAVTDAIELRVFSSGPGGGGVAELADRAAGLALVGRKPFALLGIAPGGP